MSIPSKTGDIKIVTINKVLEELDIEVGEDIYMGDFDLMGWHLASKVRDRESENYKKHAAVFRPNFERGILVHSLIQKKGLCRILEIGFGRGYATACSIRALYEKGIDGSVTTVDPALTQEKLQSLSRIMSPESLKSVSVKAVNKTSDDYFEELSEEEKFDLIFIDGDHRYDAVKKDFENAIKHIDRGYILMDDYHMPTKNDLDIEVANYVDSLGDEVTRRLVLTDRLLFVDDRNSDPESLDYGMVLIPIGDIEDE